MSEENCHNCTLPLDKIKELTESLIQLNHTINITKGYYRTC